LPLAQTKVPIHWQTQRPAGPFGPVFGPIHPAGECARRSIRSR